MSLRFRIAVRSPLGRRLLALPDVARKSYFDTVMTRGLDAVDARLSSEDLIGPSIVRALQRIESRLERVEGYLANPRQPELCARSNQPGAMPEASLADEDIRQLVGALGSLASH